MVATPYEYNFFISRRGTVATVAQEVADVLKEDGQKVLVQEYDAVYGGNFPLFIHDALVKARHLIVLYSSDYDTTHWTRQEFAHFLAAPDAKDAERRICVLRCDGTDPRGLLAGVVYGDLHGVADANQRRRIILDVAHGRAPAIRAQPRIFGGPTMPPENPQFTGREAQRADLHRLLGTEASVAVTQAAVQGLGGIGKTALARHYVAQYGHEYDGVWWLAAETEDKIVAGLDALARRMKPDLPPDSKPADNAALALDTIAGRPNGRFLLVCDNAGSVALVRRFTPQRGAAVLVTSRIAGWRTPLPLPTLAPEEAVTLLRALAPLANPDGAAELARVLGCLPLALDHAGAYVRDAAIGFPDYTRRVEALIAEAPEDADYPTSVFATFAIAIDSVPRGEPVLGLFAWFDPDSIPVSLAEAVEPEETDREAAIMALTRVSLLTRVADTACGPAVSMHRLVQMTMRARLAERSETDSAREAALGALAAAFPRGTFTNPPLWPTCRALMPHARTLLTHLDGYASVALADLCSKADNFLNGSGLTREATKFSCRALDSLERVLGPEHPETLTTRNNLAFCLRAMGDLAAAEPLFRRTLADRERAQGPEHPNTLTSRNNLADCLWAMGDLPAAEPLYRRTLSDSERVLGPEHPNTLTSRNNLAVCLRAMGDLAAVEPLYRCTLADRERVLGPEHPDTLSSRNNLAGCLYAMGDLAAAEPLFRRTLADRERVLGPEHPETLASRNNLAACLYTMGDLAAAERLYRAALASAERLLGPNHPTTVTFRNNLKRLTG